MIKNNKSKFPSELRFDSASKDWVIIATGRGKRPAYFKKKKRAKQDLPKKLCPFCNIETQRKPTLIYQKGKKVGLKNEKIPKDWSTIVIPNKYPALLPNTKLETEKEGKFYQKMNAVGFCELVVMKDHQKHFPHLNNKQIKEVFDAYHQRYLDLMEKPFVTIGNRFQ